VGGVRAAWPEELLRPFVHKPLQAPLVCGGICGRNTRTQDELWFRAVGAFFLLVGQAQSVAPIRRGPGPKVERPALQAVGEEHDDHRRQREGPVVPRTHAATVQDTGLHHKTPSSFVLKRF